MPISILFLSGSEIALPLLNALHGDTRFRLIGICCQKDKAVGRGQKIQESVFKKWGTERDIHVFQESGPALFQDLMAAFPSQSERPDYILSFAYGDILIQDILDFARLKSLNVHTSLLPKYRGASPIQSALLNGDEASGITLIEMVKKMDAGPIAAKLHINIAKEATYGDLYEIFAQKAAELLPNILSSELHFEAQDHSGASYCGKIKKEAAYLDFNKSATEIFNMYRAFTPWPMIWTYFLGKRLRFLKLKTAEMKHELPIGSILLKDKNLYLCAGNSTLIEILELQMEGKRAMQAQEFIQGYPAFASAILPS